MRRICLFLPLFLLFSLTNQSISEVKSLSIQIENPGFEQTAANRLPGKWHGGTPANIQLDSENKYSGNHSIQFNHQTWQQNQLQSEPVNLQIGHLYKLSVMAKSENAVTRPIDRYPTPVAGCIRMASFPFTNHSPAIGATADWQKIEVYFIATRESDRVNLNFGFNGKAKGKVWFDDISLQKVEDISEYIPPETVQWFGDAYRYDDRGWIFVHIEGEPYQRDYQYGYLVADEMVAYMNKLSIEVNGNDPESGWNQLRFVADAFMLRKFEKEYLTEMRGIADGANKAGLKLFGRKLDLIDVVTMNSAIDIEYAGYAAPKTPHPLSGHSFLKSEDELDIPARLHKCSSFLANKSSTTDGRIVFGQIFMWAAIPALIGISFVIFSQARVTAWYIRHFREVFTPVLIFT